MENNCKWYFSKHSGREKGPNDALEENFKAHPFYSIVREAIQNSLDAVDDITKPVKVEFKFGEISRTEYPNLIEGLRNHIKWSKEYWKDNPDAQSKFNDMLKYLDGEEEGKKRLKIPYLVISDYNTTGMIFEKDNPSTTFNAFLRSEGNSAKNDSGSGGSFGFGKAAYFNLSPFRTILVSTKNNKEQFVFEGATVLSTHKKPKSEEKLTAFGFYNCEGDFPVTDEKNIPDLFKREKTGTDVYILGLWDENNRKTQMIKSVLNNFWLSIHKNKLIVEIDDELIDNETLHKFIDEYYESENESGKANDIIGWNPKPYYKSVKNQGISKDKYFLFEDNLDAAGKVQLYVYLNKGLPNRIAYFRKPLMLVYKQTKNKLKGYVAVFICEDEKGNDILRKMENPAHNEWKIENYSEQGKPNKTARKIKNEISDFINEKLELLSGINTSNKLAIEGLEEYLSIPGELLSDEEEFDYKGENDNTKTGELSNENSNKETGVQTTTLTLVKIKPSITKSNPVKNEFEGGIDDDGESISILEGGGENETEGGTDMGKKGEIPSSENISEEGNTVLKTPLNIKFRVIVSNDKHFLIINSQYPVDNAEIEIMAGTDNGGNEVINIKNSSKGTFSGNIVKDLVLQPGKNVIEVEFEDNISHSLKLKAYELQ